MPPTPMKPLRKLRTFAEDLKLAQGNQGGVGENTTTVTATQTPAQSARTEIDELERNISSSIETQTNQIDNTSARSTSRTNTGSFTQSGEKDDESEGTIIQNHNVTRPSFFTQAQSDLTSWWNTKAAPLLLKQKEERPSTMMRVDVAPTISAPISQGEGSILQEKKIEDTSSQPLSGGWKSISEPRSEGPLPTATKEIAAEYRATLRALPSRKDLTPPVPKIPFKEMRQVRPVIPAPVAPSRAEQAVEKPAKPVIPTISPEEIAARERLLQLEQTVREKEKEVVALEEREEEVLEATRDIPFIPPPPKPVIQEELAEPAIRTISPDEVAARERLLQLAEQVREKENAVAALEKREEKVLTASRDIPFIPPPLEAATAQPIRTYRNDALTDIKENKISLPQIAAREAVRRDSGGVRYTTPRTQTQTWQILPLLAGAFCILILGTGGTFLYLKLSSGTPAQVEVVGIPSFFETTTQIPVDLPNDRSLLIQNLTSLKDSTVIPDGEFIQLYPGTTREGKQISYSTSEIMSVLDVRAPSSFVRSLSEVMMFGAYGVQKDAFIILKTTEFDTALAGMLAWEKDISIDLAPFFGEPVRKTYDSNSLTPDRTRPAYFMDQVIQNHDVRILYDESGEERILYTFIGNEYIVIATSNAALVTLLSALE